MNTQLQAVSLPGVEIPYFRFGREGGRPMLLLPGLSLANVMEFADAVVDGYAVFSAAFDVYVMERPLEVPQGVTIRGLAAVTAQALDTLGLTGLDVMGVSQGGMIAQELTLLRPDLVRSLVLGSTAARTPASSKELIAGWMTLAEQRDPAALLEAFAQAVYTPSFYEQYREALTTPYRPIADEEFVRFRRLAAAVTTFDAAERLKEIRVPALVMEAGCDRVFPAGTSEELASLLHADLHICEGYGHAAYDEDPAYRKTIVDFLLAH
ncbi:MAG: alpha/beta hydrolase [Lachnospiraceae bacterium]|nr:alpha/beta hydrolase [Lachnospiraceae bacterium]